MRKSSIGERILPKLKKIMKKAIQANAGPMEAATKQSTFAGVKNSKGFFECYRGYANFSAECTFWTRLSGREVEKIELKKHEYFSHRK